MSTMIEMVIVYALVASALLYVMRGWLMKLLFKKSTPSEEGCGACESGGCASCKIHNMPDPKAL
ncbi:MAG: hypothetical protein EBV69_13250 [Oxalobacteraceae bacterium]|jgi:hypothetical protein|nr:hypothetical protein [Alphaproteobacteria bacterium]NCW86989.1 hypothetical protein [Oxalobacteraceae bacterium]